MASQCLTSYLFNRRFLDKQYRIRRDIRFMIVDSTLSVGGTSGVSIKGDILRGRRDYGSYLLAKT